MHPDAAGHMPCLSGGAVAAAATDVSHTALWLLRYSFLEAEAT